MNIIGHGIDLVDNARIAQSVERHGDHFIERVFSEAERAYCERSAKRRFEHYGVRFAAKEAALKAIGTGWRNGIAWTDVEVARSPSGEPKLKVYGEVARIADEMGITGWRVSLSHTETHSMASVIATGPVSQENT